jgi:predicted Zn-dependent peptidase
MDCINKVTIKDLIDVVKKYLVEDKSTIGWFVPKKQEAV